MAPRDFDDEDFEYEYDEAPRRKSSSARNTSGRSTSGRSTSGRSTSGRNTSSRSTSTAKNRNASSQRTDSGRKTSGKKMSKKSRAKKKRKRLILFMVEIIILVIMLLVLWAVTKTEKVGKLEIAEEDIVVNENIADNETMKGYWNIALFGVDSTTGALTKNTRSDSIMIASINQDTKEVRLVSVYRDTYLNTGNDTYNKCNSAYAKGGPKQAMNMLNQNLDLQITDFVTIGFAGLIDVIDDLGGVTIDISNDEISHLNNYQKTIAEDLKTTYTPVSTTGTQVLNGLQATGYCRIRYTAGDDFKRAERQRTVLKAIAEEAKGASVTSLTSIANDVFDEVYTSLDLTEIIKLLGEVSSYSIVSDDGFPRSDLRATGNIGSKGSCVVPTDLSENVSWLHEYLFDEADYQPSSSVEEYSTKIKSDTSSYIK